MFSWSNHAGDSFVYNVFTFIPGNLSIKTEHVEQWLEESDDEPGYTQQSVQETVHEALTGEAKHEIASEGDADAPVPPRPSLIHHCSSLDTITTRLDLSVNTESQHYYYNQHSGKKTHHQRVRKLKILILQNSHCSPTSHPLTGRAPPLKWSDSTWHLYYTT